MTGPVGSLDSRVKNGELLGLGLNAVAQPVVGRKVEAAGAGYAETKEAISRRDASHGPPGVILHQILHKAEHVLEHAAAPAKAGLPAVAGIALQTYEMIHAWHEAHENGKKLNDALVRDAFTLSTLLIARDELLPPGFIAARRRELEPAARVVDAIRLSAPQKLGKEGMAQLEKAVNESMREGLEWGITVCALGMKKGAREVDKLASDPSLNEKLKSDIAFREGYKAAMFLARSNPGDVKRRSELLEKGDASALSFRAQIKPQTQVR